MSLPGFYDPQAKSHRSKRKQQPKITKKRNVELEDGWTAVAKSSLKAKDERENADLSQSSTPKAENVDMQELENLKAQYEKTMQRWKKSNCRRSLVGMLKRGFEDEDEEEDEMDGEGSKGTRQTWDTAVCVGLGSLSPSRDDGRGRSLWQLCLWIDVIEYFETSLHYRNIRTYIQEPRFTPLDHAFFSSLSSSNSISILSSPSAESHITPRTFLYAPFLQWAILLPNFLSQLGQVPALCITIAVHELDLWSMGSLEEVEKGRVMEAKERFVGWRRREAVTELEEQPDALMGLWVSWVERVDRRGGEVEDDVEGGVKDAVEGDERNDGVEDITEGVRDKL